MKKKALLHGLKTGALIAALTTAMPLSVHAATVVSSDGETIDVSKMTDEERKGYELTKKYEKTLPKIDPSANIPREYFSKRKANTLKGEDLESKYDSRKKGVISPVKNQDATGTCWCFSMMEATQASILSNTGVKSVDLSEFETAYFVYNHGNDRMGLTGDYVDPYYEAGSEDYYELGATTLGGIFAASGGLAFADESSAPFTSLIDDMHDKGKATLPDDFWHNNTIYTLSGVEVFNPHLDPEGVKEKIKQNGAGQISYQHKSSCYDYSTYAFYNSSGEGNGHAVTVVGWDDDYSVENFVEAPDKPGAWLIKNSWSEE